MRKIYFSILLIVFSISMFQDIGIASESKLKLSVPLNDCTEIIKGNYKFMTLVNDEDATYNFMDSKENLEEFTEKNKVVTKVEGKSAISLTMFLVFIIVANVLGLLIYFVKRKG